jgi:hypothetical protein
MKIVRSGFAAASVADLTTLPASPSHAQYLFGDPTGFNSQTVGSPSTYNFLGTGDLSVNAVFQGEGITFRTSTLNFDTGTANPSWMGGDRQMFQLSYAGSRFGGPKELAELAFTFATPLSTQSFLLLRDFDSYEGLANAAFDTSNSLIPFHSFIFTRHDGEDPLGDTFSQPSWSSNNPTQCDL